MEQWKEIREFPRYQISSLGRVKGIKGKIKQPYRGRFMKFEHKDGSTSRCLSNLVYDAFVRKIDRWVQVTHRDGNLFNFSPDNLLSTGDRDRQIIDDYKSTKNIKLVASKYKLAEHTIKEILCKHSVSFAQKDFRMPKHSSKGKMEMQVVKGEFRIPYADNCTIRPKDFDANAYLLKQFSYNY